MAGASLFGIILSELNTILQNVSRESRELSDHLERYISFMAEYKCAGPYKNCNSIKCFFKRIAINSLNTFSNLRGTFLVIFELYFSITRAWSVGRKKTHIGALHNFTCKMPSIYLERHSVPRELKKNVTQWVRFQHGEDLGERQEHFST